MVIGYTLMLCGSKTTYCMLMYAMRQEHYDSTYHKQHEMLQENKILMLKSESQHAKRYPVHNL